ncbi:MAG TPA: hypothetical protein VGK37_11630 [Casimicrobiaceae bacterium]
MKICTGFLAIGAAVLLSACSTMPDQAQQTASTECKIVLIDSASQEIRAYNSDIRSGRYQPNSPIEKTEATGGIGKAQVQNPRFRMGHNEPNNIAQAQKDC